MKILLATPTYDNTVQQVFHTSVVRLVRHYCRHHPEVEFEAAVSSGTMIDRTRNAYATRVLVDFGVSHLLFVDSDMGFAPALIEKMIAFGRPVVGCMYPTRRNDYVALYEQSRKMQTPETARAAAQNYVLEQTMKADDREPGQPARFRFIEGFVRVGQLAAGILLIQRSALELMSQRFPELWAKNPGIGYASYPWCSAGVFQCFSTFQRPDGLFISEDIAFSERWTEGCGGTLWACISEPITHVGRETFRGTFLQKLQLTRDVAFGSGLNPDHPREEGDSAVPKSGVL